MVTENTNKAHLGAAVSPDHAALPHTAHGALAKRLCGLVLVGVLATGTLTVSACTDEASSGDLATPSTQQEAQQGTKAPESTQVIEEGAIAPDFAFSTTSGEIAHLSDFSGKVVLLNFWATWCGYCIEEMPAIQQIRETYPDVEVLAINRGDSADEAIAYAQESNYDFTWGIDEVGVVQELYPANGIPYSIIIDKDGAISAIFEGSAPDMYPYFEEAVKAAGA